MIQANLSEDKLWHGRLYERGDREIPEDLARAIGLLVDAGGIDEQAEESKPKRQRGKRV